MGTIPSLRHKGGPSRNAPQTPPVYPAGKSRNQTANTTQVAMPTSRLEASMESGSRCQALAVNGCRSTSRQHILACPCRQRLILPGLVLPGLVCISTRSDSRVGGPAFWLRPSGKSNKLSGCQCQHGPVPWPALASPSLKKKKKEKNTRSCGWEGGGYGVVGRQW